MFNFHGVTKNEMKKQHSLKKMKSYWQMTYMNKKKSTRNTKRDYQKAKHKQQETSDKYYLENKHFK